MTSIHITLKSRSNTVECLMSSFRWYCRKPGRHFLNNNTAIQITSPRTTAELVSTIEPPTVTTLFSTSPLTVIWPAMATALFTLWSLLILISLPTLIIFWALTEAAARKNQRQNSDSGNKFSSHIFPHFNFFSLYQVAFKNSYFNFWKQLGIMPGKSTF